MGIGIVIWIHGDTMLADPLTKTKVDPYLLIMAMQQGKIQLANTFYDGDATPPSKKNPPAEEGEECQQEQASCDDQLEGVVPMDYYNQYTMGSFYFTYPEQHPPARLKTLKSYGLWDELPSL